MDFTNAQNTPFLQNTNPKQRFLIITIIVGVVLIILLMAANFIFSDDSYKNQLDETITQTLLAQSISELTIKYSDDTNLKNLAATSKAFTRSTALKLNDARRVAFDAPYAYNINRLNTTQYNQQLQEASNADGADEVASNLLRSALQETLKDLDQLESTTSSPSVLATIEESRESISIILNEL